MELAAIFVVAFAVTFAVTYALIRKAERCR